MVKSSEECLGIFQFKHLQDSTLNYDDNDQRLSRMLVFALLVKKQLFIRIWEGDIGGKGFARKAR